VIRYFSRAFFQIYVFFLLHRFLYHAIQKGPHSMSGKGGMIDGSNAAKYART
jgi:hypothetical protein